MPTYVRILIRLAETGLDWLTYPIEGGTGVAQWTGSYELRKLEVHWSRQPAVGVVQDDDICTFHFLNLTAGVPDASWVDADFSIVEGGVNVLWTALRPNYPPETALAQNVWRKDGPAFKPFGDSFSPTIRVIPLGTVGTGSASDVLPPQVAISVTERTSAHYTAYGVGVPGSVPGTGRTQNRNRWGRFYLPAPAKAGCTDGRLTGSLQTTIANAVKVFYNTCVAGGIIPVMYSPTTGNAWSIDTISVDDIFDVIRSRCYTTPTVRATQAINAP